VNHLFSSGDRSRINKDSKVRSLVVSFALPRILGCSKSIRCWGFSVKCLHTSDSSDAVCSRNLILRFLMVSPQEQVNLYTTPDRSRAGWGSLILKKLRNFT